MTGTAFQPPCVLKIPAMIVLLIFISSCGFGGSSPVNAESIQCVNGRLQEDGACVCDNCWTGINCNERVQPEFPLDEVRVPLNPPSSSPDNVIFMAKALGPEEVCEDIHYTIIAGNDRGHFSIDKSTGEVRASKDLQESAVPMPEEQILIIQARSLWSDRHQDSMTLKVQPSANSMVPERLFDFMGEDMVASHPYHHVHKRAAVTLPDNVNFTLSKTGNSASTTEMRVGTKVSFELQILFPKNTTDMLVELFAPDNDSIVMMLCDVKVKSIGSNLGYSGAANVVMDSQNKSSRYFDRAIIDFGNVTNSFSNTNDVAESSIYIIWDSVMIPNDKTQNNQVYWVSAGAEYNYDTEVWVGQASFTARTDAESPAPTFDSPTFNLTGPSSMMIGTSAVFRLDIYIDDPSVFLNVDAFAPLNKSDVMSICAMRVVDAGVNYQCGFKPEEITANLYRDSNTRGNDRGRLGLLTLTNKGSRDPANVAANNRISVEFVVHMYDDASYVGQIYNIGAAVEIGTQKIWAGMIKVTAAAYTATSSLSPTWNLVMGGNGKVSTVSPLLMTLDITIPQNSNGKYALEVLAPFNNSAAVFQLCSLRVVGVGSNLACTNSNPTPSYTSRGDPLYTDRIYTDMGMLSNVGPWGWQPFNLTDGNATQPDVIRVEFMVKATDHALAVVGSEHGVTLGLVIDDRSIYVGTYKVGVEAAPSLPNITEEMTPNWSLAFLGGNDNVRVGGAGQFLFTVTTKRDTVYSPFDLEALMPNSTTGEPQVSLCQIQVHSVGVNLPCVVAAAVNRSITYTSSFGNDSKVYDRGVVNLKSLCNKEVKNDTEEDKLVLKVGFKVHEGAGLTNGTELWPSVGVMFSPYRMWVGQIKAWARTDLSNSAGTPHVAVVKLSGNVPVGYVAKYNVLIKSVPGNIVKFTMNVSVSMPGLSVCSIKVVQVGNNMPCTNGSLIEARYEPDTNGINTEASVDIGTVANVGTGTVATNDTVDDNTLVVEVMIGVTSDTAVIADMSSSHKFDAKIYHDGAAITASVPTFTAIHDQSSLSSMVANVSGSEVNVLPITESDNTTDVVLGQSKRLELCAWTYPGSVTKLTFKMMTPIGQSGTMELVHVRTSFGGNNMPCVGSCKSGKATYSSRSGSSYTDIGTVDYGYVVNNKFDTVNTDANKVCVDAIFRVLKNDSLTTGTVLQPAASLNVNNVEIDVTQQSFTVRDNSTFKDTYMDNATLVSNTIIKVNSSLPSPLCMKPGEVQTLPVVLTIPPYITSLVNMDIKMDLNESACMTYRDMRLVSVGKNLKGFGKDYDLQCTANSTMGTTQMDTVQCSLGVVTNPAMSHRCKDQSADDDAINLEMDFQMADCPAAEKDANLTASLGLKVAGYIAILNFPVTVCRDGSETAVYNITAQANSTGDTMYVEYDIRLDNTSTAEVRNVSLVIIKPPYILFDKLQSSSGTNGAPVVDTSSVERVIIGLGSMYFTDGIKLLGSFKANSGYQVPNGISGHHTVVNHQLSGDVIPRAGSSLTSNTVWSRLDYVNFTAATTSQTGVSCTSAKLNLADSNVIYDCQISASVPSLSVPTNGRMGGTGWIPYVREGPLLAERYFQVYFANKMKVDKVEVGQSSAARATRLKLAYSDDGQSFLDGDTINLAGQTQETVTVPTPRDSQVLRVYVTNSNRTDQQLKLTFEFYGCATSSGGPTGSTAVCAAVNTAIPPKNTDALFFRRSFLAIPTGSVIACDGVVQTKKTVSRCFFSADGTTWRTLDTRVAAMVGHDPDTKRTFALSDDGVTFMSSGDDGLTWASTHRDAVTKAQAKPLYVAAKDVPWTDAGQLPRGAPQTAYRSNNWGAGFDYLQKNDGSWNNKLKWNCC